MFAAAIQAPEANGNGKLEPSAMEDDCQSPIRTPQKSASKARSLSDSTPRLEPSPKFREPARMSKDDHTIVTATPSTPRRPDFLTRGLSLQMPPKDMPMPSPAHFAARVPLSPQLDARNTYASPTSLLPRRSRGAEFSRACTNLHHSTLPEQNSPDSSPTITQKGIKIPSRKPRSNSMIMHSPSVGMGGWGNGDRTAPSSSMGSINMMGSEESSSSSDEGDPMDPDDNDDPMMGTPQAKINSAFPGAVGASHWAANLFSPGMPNFMSIQRARLRKGRSRKSSSSASGHSSMASPGPASPPNGINKSEGYFAREAAMRNKAPSRRESLSIFANDLHISSGNDSGDEAATLPQTPGVVRRPVVRRGNLLPKSRQFGRIKAELFEEAAPVDSEVRREAEIIRQVRESDIELEPRPSGTAHSSPSLLPAVPGLDGPLEGVPEEESEGGLSLDGNNGKGLFGAFGSLHTSRSSISTDFWNSRPAQTPPPPSFPRAESSAISEDMSLDSPTISSSHGTNTQDQNNSMGWTSRASTPGPMYPPSAADGLKKSNKRRRDDDFDEASIKRRAVSPGVSVHNSPIISQSPAQRDGFWGTTGKNGREPSISGHSQGERSNSGGSMIMTPTLGPKRIGLQGMEYTSDGFMKMSIE